jgi:predicted ester cyclase
VSPDDNKLRSRQYWAAIAETGPEAGAEFLSPGHVYHRADYSGWREGASAPMKALFAAFPDLTHVVIDQVEEDDTVIERIRYFGTHLGTFMGIPATGRRVTFTGMGCVRFENGKQVERWEVADDAGLRRQLLGEPDPNEMDTHKALAREYYEGNDRYGIHNGAAFGRDSVYHGANYTGFTDTDPGSRGRKYYEAFPDFYHVIMEQIAEGDLVMERIRYFATHRAVFMGIPATDKRITYTGMDWVRFEEGQAVERWGVADSLAIRRQLLGLADPTPEKTWYGDFPRDPNIVTPGDDR